MGTGTAVVMEDRVTREHIAADEECMEDLRRQYWGF